MAEEKNNQPEESRKKKKAKPTPGAPAWMVTYSDLVTLLLTFFVLLMSMANLDPVRFSDASYSLKEAFGMHAKPARVEFALPVLPSLPKSKFNPVQTEMTTKVFERVKAQIDEFELGEDIEAIRQDADTIVLRLTDSVLFKPGEARLEARSFPTLRRLSDMIRPLPASLRIEGHTDDQPIAAPGYDNWELSIARAVSVTRFYEQGDLLPLDRMAAIGYGDSRPIVQNTSEENRARNRRVDFVLNVKDISGTGPASNGAGKIPL